jgi:pimeloyl-ACP methyl ester carboxylesterase
LQRPRLGERAIRHVPGELIHTALGWDLTHNGDFTPAIRQQIADDYKRADPHIMYLLPSVSDLTAELEAVTMPVQVIWGKNDLTLDPRLSPASSRLPDAHGHPTHGHQPHVASQNWLTVVVNYL